MSRPDNVQDSPLLWQREIPIVIEPTSTTSTTPTAAPRKFARKRPRVDESTELGKSQQNKTLDEEKCECLQPPEKRHRETKVAGRLIAGYCLNFLPKNTRQPRKTRHVLRSLYRDLIHKYYGGMGTYSAIVLATLFDDFDSLTHLKRLKEIRDETLAHRNPPVKEVYLEVDHHAFNYLIDYRITVASLKQDLEDEVEGSESNYHNYLRKHAEGHILMGLVNDIKQDSVAVYMRLDNGPTKTESMHRGIRL